MLKHLAFPYFLWLLLSLIFLVFIIIFLCRAGQRCFELLALIGSPFSSHDFPGVDHEGRQTCRLFFLLIFCFLFYNLFTVFLLLSFLKTCFYLFSKITWHLDQITLGFFGVFWLWGNIVLLRIVLSIHTWGVLFTTEQINSWIVSLPNTASSL